LPPGETPGNNMEDLQIFHLGNLKILKLIEVTTRLFFIGAYHSTELRTAIDPLGTDPGLAGFVWLCSKILHSLNQTHSLVSKNNYPEINNLY
jgi:hypothetical protein